MSENFDKPAYARKFLDIEATVDEAEDEFGSEHESDQELFVDDEVFKNSGDQATNYLWKDLDQWDETCDTSPAFLDKLAREIQHRHRSQHLRPDESNASLNEAENHPIPQFPTDQDSLWRIKVKIGFERDIVVQIIQKVLRTSSVHGVLSAFCRDAIKGNIYIESTSITDTVSSILVGIPGIARSHRGGYFISMVEVQDRHLLLSMDAAGARPPIKPRSWVRMKRGKYRGDLGLVEDVDLEILTCTAYFVPRISMDRKRKRGVRAPQLPLDLEAIKERFSPGAAERRNGLYLFKGDIYKHGLLYGKFHMTDLSIDGINPTPQELAPFHVTGELWERSQAFIEPIKVGDWVRVISGAFIGYLGEVVDVSDMTMRVSGRRKDGRWEDTDILLLNEATRRSKWGGSRGDIIEVLTRDVRKAFETGDFVQVMSGNDRGLEGFLVHVEDEFGIIYVLPAVQKVGFEIKAYIAQLEWKSSVVDRIPDVSSTSSDAPTRYTRYDPAHPVGLPYASLNSSVGLSKQTVDRYKHMEVQILKGAAKRHFGTIKGTHRSPQGDELVEVLTSTQAINTTITYRIKDVQERFTNLPIDKACWIPARLREPQVLLPDSSAANKPATPLPTPQEVDANSSTTAWDPKATPLTALDTPTQPTGPLPGEWLLDQRLLYKKLDVRVKGTTLTHPPWQGGRFENQLGFLVLTKKVQSILESTIVKTGFLENRAVLQLQYLVPEHSTEVPTFRAANGSSSNVSIASQKGTRVVIIGPDTKGCSDYIGQYALVALSEYALPENWVLIQIATPGVDWGTYLYTTIDSLCRSNITPRGEPIDWFGIKI